MSFQLDVSPKFLVTCLFNEVRGAKAGVEVPGPGAVLIRQSCHFFFLSFVFFLPFKGDFLLNIISQIAAIVEFVQIPVKIEMENRLLLRWKRPPGGQGVTVTSGALLCLLQAPVDDLGCN